MFFGGGGEGVPGGVGELLLVAGDLTAQVADIDVATALKCYRSILLANFVASYRGII
ncbi:hypothetical protein NIES39_A05780 [Arthrospira platensis NIES-39]|nr:hypothetical protein NIES39_A05780 [Arthrospira platensis NIES-39]